MIRVQSAIRGAHCQALTHPSRTAYCAQKPRPRSSLPSLRVFLTRGRTELAPPTFSLARVTVSSAARGADLAPGNTVVLLLLLRVVSFLTSVSRRPSVRCIDIVTRTVHKIKGARAPALAMILTSLSKSFDATHACHCERANCRAHECSRQRRSID